MRDGLRLSLVAVVVLAIAAGGIFFFKQAQVFQPLPPRLLSSYAPPEARSPRESTWTLLPFFYVTASFPAVFMGEPVNYELPYFKGPPLVFVDHVIARWQSPDILLVIDAPKTPLELPPIEDIRKCLQSSFGCTTFRTHVLLKHQEEMRAAGMTDVTLQWFEIQNQALSEAQRPRGILMSGRGEKDGHSLGQERAIFITPGGKLQALILTHPLTMEGRDAEDAFAKVLGSARVTADLMPGRAVAVSQLATVNLEDMQGFRSVQDYLREAARISAILISKITVDPGGALAYYHLGGSSFLTARHAADIRTRTTQIISGPFLTEINESFSSCRTNIRSALYYLRDIAPEADNTKRLEQYWAEVQKL